MSVTQIDFFSRLKLAIEDYSHCFSILRQQATQPAKDVYLTLFLTLEVRIPNFLLELPSINHQAHSKASRIPANQRYRYGVNRKTLVISQQMLRKLHSLYVILAHLCV